MSAPRNLLLIILTLLCSIPLFAQRSMGFEEGVITKKDGTQIRAFVEVAANYDARVYYRKSGTEDKLYSVKSSDVHSIKTDFRYLQNIRSDNKERLMFLIEDGKLKLFTHLVMHSFRPQQFAGTTTAQHQAPTTYHVVIKEGIAHTIKKSNFREELADLVRDQETIFLSLSKPELQYEDMASVIKSYNLLASVRPRDKTIIARIVDSKTNEPVRTAQVSLSGTEIKSITNHLGYVQLNVNALDTLVIRHPDYETGKAVLPQNGQNIKVQLSKRDEPLKERIVGAPE